MTKLERLKKAETLSDLARIIGYKPKAISFIIYRIPEENKYREFTIPKKNGNTRKINAPTDKLKKLQKHLANLLNDCLDEITSKNKNLKSLSHGFRHNHSIITNAIKHKNKRYVFNVDIQNFFPSINFGRVRGFFIKNHHFNLNEKVATVIAQIACYKNELPQGSPSSPVISNLIGHILDIKMVNLAKKTKCTYSRYADDLTFSTNKKKFPTKIAIKEDNNHWIVGKTLKSQIEKIGFMINENKTSMQYKTSRQITTGLIVNEKVNTRKEYYKNARAMCHKLFISDEYYIDNMKGSLSQLIGILNFIYQIKTFNDKTNERKRRNNPTAITKLYRSLLSYKYFFSLNKPLIICEGKTDIIYLRCALKQLADSYNTLVDKDDNIIYKLNFLNKTKNFRKVFAISKGVSGLKYLIDLYEKNIKMFKGNGGQHPVIIILDNDEATKKIKSEMKKKDMQIINNLAYNYFKNLYIMFISEKDGEIIEDLFDSELLKTKINGKIFNRTDNIDTSKEYGKIIFAEKVVREKQSEIDFTKFKVIFDTFNSIIAYHQNLLHNKQINPTAEPVRVEV